MNDFSFEVGRIVVSKQGRDKGRAFIVLELINENFVMLIDGDLRKLSKPKLKKVKHLRSTPYMANDFISKLINKQNILDSDIRKEIDRIREEC